MFVASYTVADLGTYPLSPPRARQPQPRRGVAEEVSSCLLLLLLLLPLFSLLLPLPLLPLLLR